MALPSLDPSQLNALAQALKKSGLSKQGQNYILQSLNAASNPQSETAEFGIASLDEIKQLLVLSGIDILDEAFAEFDFDIPDDVIEDIDDTKTDDSGIVWTALAILLSYFEIPTTITDTVYESILATYIASWQDGIQSSVLAHGCTAAIPSPSGGDLSQLQSWAQEDTDSIRNTYEKEKENQLQSLLKSNPDEDAAFFVSEMQAWYDNRTAWKNPQIMLNTVQKAYGYALQRFHEMNKLKTKYRLVGVPPVCPICIDLFGRGHVDFDTVQQYPMPIHINCPHSWEAVSTPQLDCASIWAG